jgi:hypothetical protein
MDNALLAYPNALALGLQDMRMDYAFLAYPNALALGLQDMRMDYAFLLKSFRGHLKNPHWWDFFLINTLKRVKKGVSILSI